MDHNEFKRSEKYSVRSYRKEEERQTTETRCQKQRTTIGRGFRGQKLSLAFVLYMLVFERLRVMSNLLGHFK